MSFIEEGRVHADGQAKLESLAHKYGVDWPLP
jgi:hypothetical protein